MSETEKPRGVLEWSAHVTGWVLGVILLLWRALMMLAGAGFIIGIIWYLISPPRLTKGEIDSMVVRPIAGRAPLVAWAHTSIRIDENCLPARLSINFGDGSQKESDVTKAQMYSVWHQYIHAGTYEITAMLFESDRRSCNLQATVKKTIRVQESIPPGADVCAYAMPVQDIRRSGSEYVDKQVTIVITPIRPFVENLYMYAQRTVGSSRLVMLDSESGFRVDIGPFLGTDAKSQLQKYQQFVGKRTGVTGVIEKHEGQYQIEPDRSDPDAVQSCK